VWSALSQPAIACNNIYRKLLFVIFQWLRFLGCVFYRANTTYSVRRPRRQLPDASKMILPVSIASHKECTRSLHHLHCNTAFNFVKPVPEPCAGSIVKPFARVIQQVLKRNALADEPVQLT